MALKLRLLTKFPALVQVATGLAVERVGRVYTFMLDLLAIASVDSVADLTTRYLVMVSDNGDGTALYERVSIQDYLDITQGFVQTITDPGPADISPTATTVVVNQTAGAAITLNLPASTDKIGAVKIVDMKGDAATNNITVMPNGSETFNGGATSWVIGGDSASLVFTPIPGIGYGV